MTVGLVDQSLSWFDWQSALDRDCKCNRIRDRNKSIRMAGTFPKKKAFEVDLLAGEELQALAKEVVVQPPEIIGQIRKLMGE